MDSNKQVEYLSFEHAPKSCGVPLIKVLLEQPKIGEAVEE
jgi:hypothetical protein